jgi:hypothetical protein
MLFYNNPLDCTENDMSQCYQPDYYPSMAQSFDCPYAGNDMYRNGNNPMPPNTPMMPNPSPMPNPALMPTPNMMPNPTLMPNASMMPNPSMMPSGSLIPTLPNYWDLGPIKIEWSFDGKSINAILKVFEKAVREVVLSMAKPMVSITTEIGDTTINLKVNADFVSNFVAISGAVCFDTVCTTFNNTVIARW